MFKQDYMLQAVFIKGEVSNCKYHSSGHIYFTLKDQIGTLSCVMFAGNRSGLGFRLLEGQQVVVGGTIDVYERDGKYQIYAKQIILDGAGQLYEKFEQLKKELNEMGLFAPEYKQPIPRFIKTLGVVTADTGAAFRDIVQIATRRNPYVQIILCPATVQGDAAASSIVNGIKSLEKQQVDVIIVGRGGGSIEDLWAFNEKEVAQAVFDCSIPIISAVGHETDTTIIDFVSDLRAPTPSAAAELAVYDVVQMMETLNYTKDRLDKGIQRRIREKREIANRYEHNIKIASPISRIREQKTQLLFLEDKIQELIQRIIRDKKHTQALLMERLNGLSPLNKLVSGYSYVEDGNGKNVRSVGDVEEGQNLKIRVIDGEINAKIESILKEVTFYRIK